MNVSRQDLRDALPRLRGQRVAVVGDLLLDEYIYGSGSRLSREAFLPVFEPVRTVTQPGGGAFPPLAIRVMGSDASLIGCAGDDATAAVLRGHLRDAGVNIAGVVAAPGRTTTRKTRYMAEGFFRFPQQVFRVDHLPRDPFPAAQDRQMAEAVRAVRDVDAFLVSDYGQGTASTAVVEAVRETARRLGIPATVDSQRSLDPYHRFALVRNNRAEAVAYLGVPLPTVRDVLDALPRLQTRLDAANVVVSLGADGLAYKGESDAPQYIPAGQVDVFDVTGAGDTLIVVLTLALAAGLSLDVAARLGNLAAGVAVRRLGNVAVGYDDLHAAIEEADDALFVPPAQSTPDGGSHG